MAHYMDKPKQTGTSSDNAKHWTEGGTTTLALVDRGDFLLLTALTKSKFLIGLKVSTSLL